MNNFIQFEFGNQHKKRIEEWYSSILPNSKVFAKTRTYEVALSMVQSGRGVALVPALAARLGGEKLDFDVNLYKTNLPPFYRLISLIISGDDDILIMKFASRIKLALPKINDVPPILESLE